jgi:hypothetical protein
MWLYFSVCVAVLFTLLLLVLLLLNNAIFTAGKVTGWQYILFKFIFGHE